MCEVLSLDMIKRLMAQFFPKHNYIPHYFVKNIKIEGSCPYGEQYCEGEKFSLYEYLFSYKGKFSANSTTVIE